ncbi:MAG: hypothetical protein Q4G30_02030 [Actinomycetaceae bacterium]|nr:hypothetical protein [Actinomycetaceae bacterium]
MIDHLTPFEGITFGSLVMLGLFSVVWGGEGTNITIGAMALGIGVIGGLLTFIRALAEKPASSIYLMVFALGLIGILITIFVFPDEKFSAKSMLWIGLIGALGSGVLGIALNALIRAPEPEPVILDEQLEEEEAQEDNPLPEET